MPKQQKTVATPEIKKIARISLEQTQGEESHLIVMLGLPNESKMTDAISALVGLIPDDTEGKAEAHQALIDAIAAATPCISYTRGANGSVDRRDYALLAGHPDLLGERKILGGSQVRVGRGWGGQPTARAIPRNNFRDVINPSLKALGLAEVQPPQNQGYGGFPQQGYGAPGAYGRPAPMFMPTNQGQPPQGGDDDGFEDNL